MSPAVTPDQIDRFRTALAGLAGDVVPARRLGVAVSGGPDSLALLLVAAAVLPGRLAAATVDHGLRPAASGEAAMVAEVCATIGVPHRVLAGRVAERSSLQQEARRLRYRLLGEWAGEEMLGAVATAHHLDDQAETFLMRAVRGAGVGGLAGVRKRVALAGVPVPVIRPLLGWRRAELGGIVSAAGLIPVDDPSNHDAAYDRTGVRAVLGQTPQLRTEGLAAAAAHLADAEEALGWMVARFSAERLLSEGGTIRFVEPTALPRELRRRIAQTAIQRLSGSPAPRGDALDRLMGLLDSGRAGTLAGVLVRPGPDWHFTFAPPRADHPRNRVGSPGASIAINPDRLI